MNLNGLVTCGVVALVAGSTLGDTVLQIDIDALSAKADSAFSATYTGGLHVFNTAADPDTDLDAKILDVLIDGVAQGTGGATVGAFHFDMTIAFSAGKITSGLVTVKVDQTGSEQTYSASLSPSSGVAILDVGGGYFVIGGLTFAGTFATPAGTFLGVDISTWGSAQPVPGSFSDIAFNPDSSHEDSDTDVDLFIIPLPSGAALAGVGLSGLLVRRRR